MAFSVRFIGFLWQPGMLEVHAGCFYRLNGRFCGVLLGSVGALVYTGLLEGARPWVWPPAQ